MNIQTVLNGMSQFARETLLDYIDKECAKAAESERKKQLDEDINAAVMSYAKCGLEDVKIYDLLRDYFCISDFDEIRRYTQNGRINFKIQEFREYLRTQELDIHLKVASPKELERMLQKDSNLLGKTPEKLLKIVEKEMSQSS